MVRTRERIAPRDPAAHRIAAEDEMNEAERSRDDIDRGDHPARAISPVGRRAREAVAGQVMDDDAVIAAQPLGQRLPRLASRKATAAPPARTATLTSHLK